MVPVLSLICKTERRDKVDFGFGVWQVVGECEVVFLCV